MAEEIKAITRRTVIPTNPPMMAGVQEKFREQWGFLLPEADRAAADRSNLCDHPAGYTADEITALLSMTAPLSPTKGAPLLIERPRDPGKSTLCRDLGKLNTIAAMREIGRLAEWQRVHDEMRRIEQDMRAIAETAMKSATPTKSHPIPARALQQDKPDIGLRTPWQ
jgi:hypothetical protein